MGLKKFHRTILNAGEAGILSRQELVSMLPPLMLDLHQDDLVLDMCAAPGSKTGEIMELLHLKSLGSGQKPKGGVVANDMDVKRAYMLTHQVKRINTGGIAVINHEGQNIPSVFDSEGNEIYYDKVLVDVPCSGDGAIRKLPNRWRKWSTLDGLSLHPVQIDLFKRAIELTKPGGKVVYSTCSLNPIENEAVIAEVMRLANEICPGGLVIEDAHSKINDFKGRRGMYSWIVAQKNKKGPKRLSEENHTFDELFTIVDEYNEELYKKSSGFMRQSMFPLPAEQMKALGVEKALRVQPSDQNTGGFFIAVFTKTKEFLFGERPKVPEPEAKVEVQPKEDMVEEEEIVKKKVKRTDHMKVQEFTPMKEIMPEAIANIQEYYGLSEVSYFSSKDINVFLGY